MTFNRLVFLSCKATVKTHIFDEGTRSCFDTNLSFDNSKASAPTRPTDASTRTHKHKNMQDSNEIDRTTMEGQVTKVGEVRDCVHLMV